MDATSNTSETDKGECMGHDRDDTEDPASSTTQSLPQTTAAENEELHCCDDEEYKRKLDDLKVKEKEKSARLETLERGLTQTQAKMRICDDMLVLIGLLRDRLCEVYPEVEPLLGDEDAAKGQTDFATVPRAN